MRHAAKVDQNHPAIVECLRKLGCAVLSLAAIGKGCPDLLISYRKHMYLIEVKNEKGKLNAMQQDWHRAWDSPVYVVKTTGECVSLLNQLRSNYE